MPSTFLRLEIQGIITVCSPQTFQGPNPFSISHSILAHISPPRRFEGFCTLHPTVRRNPIKRRRRQLTAPQVLAFLKRFLLISVASDSKLAMFPSHYDTWVLKERFGII